jgi:hypothetical protein
VPRSTCVRVYTFLAIPIVSVSIPAVCTPTQVVVSNITHNVALSAARRRMIV